MNPYEIIMKIDQKMKTDSKFATKFNKLVGELNRKPGLQQEILRIAQIQNEAQRQKALSRLPEDVKQSVQEMFDLLMK